MVLFTGEYRPSLDEKGRIALPTKIRKKRTSEGVESELREWVFTYGYDHCVMAMPMESWTTFVEEKISSLPKSQKENRQKVRLLLSGAYECELDQQGRFILPNNLKEYAGLQRSIVIIGVGDYLELWDEEVYAREVPKDDDTMNKFASEFWN